MAKLVTGRTHPISGNSGMNMDHYQAGGVFDYQFHTQTSSKVRLYDNAANDIVFTGSGFTGNVSTGLTGGTITSIVLHVAGATEFSLTGLSMSAKQFYAYVAANKTALLWSIGLKGNDLITGTKFNDILSGFGGNDQISGDAGVDKVNGGLGADKITGGTGNDKLTGGSGADHFIYTKVPDSPYDPAGSGVAKKFAKADVISDFVSGTDKIDVSAIDANISTVFNQFVYKGNTTQFSHQSFVATPNFAELIWYQSGGNTYVLANVNDTAPTQTGVDGGWVNQDETPDLAIKLLGLHTLTQNDFIL
jgi:serralysin